MQDPYRNAAQGATKLPPNGLDANSRRSIKAARSRRLKKRLAPFEEIDKEVVDLIRRLDPEGHDLGTNAARTVLQAQTLRKELLLGKLKAEEVERKLEESDVREEWEKVKRELGIS